MGDRTVPFDPKAICDDCGKPGAYDFMGDLICDDCLPKCKHESLESVNADGYCLVCGEYQL